MPLVVDEVSPAERTKTKNITIEFGEDESGKPRKHVLPITYRPSSLSAGDDPELPSDGATDETITEAQRLAFARRMCAIVAKWDLEGPVRQAVADSSGVVQYVEVIPAGPIPLEPLVVARITFELLVVINNAIIQGVATDPTRRRQS